MSSALANLWAWIVLDNNEIAGVTNRVSVLEAKVKGLQMDVATVLADIAKLKGDVTTKLAAVSAQIAALQAQIAGGAGVTAADLQSIDDAVNAVDAVVNPPAPTPPSP